MEVKSSADLEREYLRVRSNLKGVLKILFGASTCIAIVTFTMGLTLPASQCMANTIFSSELTLIANIVAYSCFAASVLTYYWTSKQERFVRFSTLAIIGFVAKVIGFLSETNTESAGSPGVRIAYFTIANCCVLNMVGVTWLINKFKV